MKNQSNVNAAKRWNKSAVGSQRSQSPKGTLKYFQEIENYRYGYETPFIPSLLCDNVKGKKILEIGVGNGIDAKTLIKNGALYTGLDITENHLSLTEINLNLHKLNYNELICSDMLDHNFKDKFDVVYSFGVLHHIIHEKKYLSEIYKILNDNGELRVGLYSKYSFFNIYLYVTWICKNRCRVSFNVWQGFVSDAAPFDCPVTIKIRSKKEIINIYEKCGFYPVKYYKRGFVQNYIPVFGKYFHPNGKLLRFLSSLLGWYHVFHFKKIQV